MHPRRRRDRDLILHLAREERWDEAFRRVTLYDFGVESWIGHQLAFLRSFASPPIAEVLADTGQMHIDALDRSTRTAVLMLELFSRGLDSPEAKRVLRVINTAHRAPGVTQVDQAYLLRALIVSQVKMIETLGWRPLEEADVLAIVHFMARLGSRMGIEDLPTSYPEVSRHVAAYEADVHPTPATLQFSADALGIVRHAAPRALHPILPNIFATLLGDNPARIALDLPQPSLRLARAISAAQRSRATVLAWTPPPTAPYFTSGQPSGPGLPHGYAFEDLLQAAPGELTGHRRRAQHGTGPVQEPPRTACPYRASTM